MKLIPNGNNPKSLIDAFKVAGVKPALTDLNSPSFNEERNNFVQHTLYEVIR